MTDSRRPAGATAALIVAAAGFLFTAGLMLVVSEPAAFDAGGWLVLGAFMAFAVSPYVALAIVARRLRGRAVGWAAFAAALLMTVPASILYVLAFFVEPDAQSGLLFIFMPLYQFLAGGAAALITAILLRLRAGAR